MQIDLESSTRSTYVFRRSRISEAGLETYQDVGVSLLFRGKTRRERTNDAAEMTIGSSSSTRESGDRDTGPSEKCERDVPRARWDLIDARKLTVLIGNVRKTQADRRRSDKEAR